MGKAPTGISERDAAFAAVYRSHVATIRGTVRLSVAPHEVDEIVSATFTTAWERFDEMPAHAVKPWLLTVARYHMRNKFRSKRRIFALAEAIEATRPRTEAELFQNGIDPTELEPLMAAIETLEADDQELLALTAWQDLTTEEIANVLNIRPGTARVRLHRARRRLEGAYRRHIDDEGDVA